MGLDIRLPIGLMFTIVGLLLAGFGLLGDKSIYQRSLGINVNLWWGLVMLAFGVFMLALGRRGTSAMRPAETTPEGLETERREHRAGLEREQ
jgi:hypothetical protein